LVISGTHLTILFNVVGYLLLFIVANYWLNIGILALFLITFLFLTGMSSSILRATLFWVFLMLGKINSRITNYTNGLLATLFIFFIINPLTVIYDIGFHLSFLSIMALVYILPILNKLINCKSYRWKFVIDVFNSTLAVTILLLPYLIYQFTEFNILSIVFNIILIPISGIILSIAFIAIMLGFGSIILAKMLGLLVSWMVNVFLWMLNILNIVSLRTNIILFNSIFFVMIYYIILVILVVDFYLKEKKLTFNL
jgi:competence protein ComEC